MKRVATRCKPSSRDFLANRFRWVSSCAVAFAAVLFIAWTPATAGLASVAPAQETSKTLEELVADLAAGRVIIAVVKDAIVIACVENPVEAETRTPTPVEINISRAGIILGSVDWFSPSSQEEVAQLNQDLPHLHSTSVAIAPHLQSGLGGDAASDIQTIGQGFLERLNSLARDLHGKVELPSNDPVAELIVADYIGGYGPEVWQLSFGMKQVEEQRDYWSTRVTMPRYLQFWPPDTGQPHTLMEFDYPLENAPASLLDLLKRSDPRVQPLLSGDPSMSAVATAFLQGDSRALRAADSIQFLRAALQAIAPKSRQAMAVIGEETGFQWVIHPPPETPRPPTSSAQQALPQDRPADAPSLLGHH